MRELISHCHLVTCVRAYIVRSQDHYALLGLKNLGYEPYKAPMALIHAAFKKQTMCVGPRSHSDLCYCRICTLPTRTLLRSLAV
jgi:hypothetical protein